MFCIYQRQNKKCLVYAKHSTAHTVIGRYFNLCPHAGLYDCHNLLVDSWWLSRANFKFLILAKERLRNSSRMSSSSEIDDIPSDIEEAASNVVLNLVPEKSRKKYQLAYRIGFLWPRCWTRITIVQ